MKKFLEDLIARKNSELSELKERNEKSENLEEVREIGSQIEKIVSEIRDAENQLAEIEKEDSQEGTDTEPEARSAFNPAKALNVVGNYNQNNNAENRGDNDLLSSMEYRKEFMNYAKTGVRSEALNKILLEVRDDAPTATENVSSDLGVLIPNTVMSEVIKKLEKVRGNIYSRVRKLNIPGGVEFSIGDFDATFTWSGSDGTDTEHGVSTEQKGGSITGSVTFKYHIGEVRIAESLLTNILSVEAFEKELINALVKSFLTAMDKAIMFGSGVGQPTGILTDVADGLKRIDNSHIIEFTEEEIADWTVWEKKFFGVLPIALESSSPEFMMAKQTYVSNLCTLKDKNNQPINKAGFDSSDKKHKFNEYDVNRVEQDIFKAFDLCEDGDVFGMFWAPEEAYGVNSNMAFGYKRYFDDDKNKYINKGLVIVDGKILNPEYIYLLKKKVTA